MKDAGYRNRQCESLQMPHLKTLQLHSSTHLDNVYDSDGNSDPYQMMKAKAVDILESALLNVPNS